MRRSTPTGEPVFATAAPGNALRTLLACGFRPTGSEVVVNHDVAPH
ncbi:hypothetical protein FHX42_000081 [Saccharopolyspora lacisalsi]|uniref:Uncharacterized protein n=1 Tax=Halosaccharopolyspora lacisalsi TaxID=1000566 RepID=A0A839DLC7_9PSEU|nr:hypothetical protein [Halosaccharopolyspora lacisalsi]MBA8822752.1 hypothetical protein [Halosaccharopolyspora lacisalsi]